MEESKTKMEGNERKQKWALEWEGRNEFKEDLAVRDRGRESRGRGKSKGKGKGEEKGRKM